MKNYTVTFGAGDPRGFTGLSPTFLLFWNLASGTTNAPPSISELVVGKTGIYTFQYGVTQPLSFLIDAATTSPGAQGRYVTGQIDPSDRSDEYGNTLVAFGMSILTQVTATGNTVSTQSSYGASFKTGVYAALGVTTASIGSTGIDPTTVFGFLMRAQEIAEGNETYTKATGILDFYTRGNTLLVEKTISDNSTATTKT